MPTVAEIRTLSAELGRIAAQRRSEPAEPESPASGSEEVPGVDAERLAAAAEDLMDRFEAEIRDHPRAAVAAAFGIGLVLGLAMRR
ncbi:hypothetical protein [Prosthecomicrobium sp. N25]|uniref:hypothetical protein n=1 Tax=Prosthecomicrobium sp. N25 TaxID=3129254 RepID=UPI003077E55F